MYTNSQVEVVFKRITSFRFLPATPLQQPTTSRSTAMLAPWPNQFRGAKNCAKNREKLVVGPQHTRKIWKYGFSMCGYWNHTGLPLWSLQTNTFENSNLSGSCYRKEAPVLVVFFAATGWIDSYFISLQCYEMSFCQDSRIKAPIWVCSIHISIIYPNAENTRICNFTRICDFCTIIMTLRTKTLHPLLSHRCFFGGCPGHDKNWTISWFFTYRDWKGFHRQFSRWTPDPEIITVS